MANFRPNPDIRCNKKDMKNPAIVLVALTLIAVAPAGAEQADFVFRNGLIWSVDPDNPKAKAIATHGDKILFVGSVADVSNYVNNASQIVDLKGQLLLPGFNDNHVHFDQTGRLLYGLNLLDVAEEREFIARIKAVNKRYPAGSWITGGDWSAYETWAAGDVGEAGAEVNPDDPYGNLFLPDKAMIDGFTKERGHFANCIRDLQQDGCAR